MEQCNIQTVLSHLLELVLQLSGNERAGHWVCQDLILTMFCVSLDWIYLFIYVFTSLKNAWGYDPAEESKFAKVKAIVRICKRRMLLFIHDAFNLDSFSNILQVFLLVTHPYPNSNVSALADQNQVARGAAIFSTLHRCFMVSGVRCGNSGAGFPQEPQVYVSIYHSLIVLRD